MPHTQYESIPGQYAHLINQEDYIKILELSQDYLIKYGQITGLDDGIILFEDSKGESQRFGLDNLVRKLNGQDHNTWENIIREHFDSLFNDSESQFDFNDLDQIRKVFLVRIYPDGYFEDVNFQDKIVYKVDFEETKSTLVFDLGDKFKPVKIDEFRNWGINTDEAFSIAKQNVKDHEIEIFKQNYENGFELYSFSGDHAASLILDLSTNADYAVGQYGSLVSIPTKSSGFVVPINVNNIALILGDIHEMIINCYNEDPGPITTNYYWYFNKIFSKFPITVEKSGFRSYHMPIELEKLLTMK